MAGLALAASALLAACTSAGPGDPGDAEHPFETVLAETYSGLAEPRREVIRDEAAWARLWGEIHAVVDPLPPRPPVDFARDMLFAVATGTRPTGGFSIKVRRVATRGASLEVTVLETCPGPGAMVTQGLSQPVEVVRVPRLAPPATFREERASCR
ncbi:MAG TPA: protease complex subunit PrcB family protein [Vicinamibacteria bacterium]